MKQFVIKKWRRITLMSGLLACLGIGILLVFPSPAPNTTPQTLISPIVTSDAQKVESVFDAAPVADPTAAPTTGQTAAKSAAKSSGTPAISSTSSNPSQTSTTEDITQPTSLSVTLQINGKTAGNVSVASNANQCDILSVALAQGIISSLDMQYNSTYGTYGVYVINGQGDHNIVWWTYTINGKSPPVGCSKQRVSGGEIINWQYIGR